jgi:hypothetical protein
MNMTNEAYLITAISVMSGAIVWLALYIRKMHNERVKDMKETKDVLLKVVDKNTEAYFGMKASIDMNTIATKNGAEEMRGATDRLSTAVDNLNRDMRNNKSER